MRLEIAELVALGRFPDDTKVVQEVIDRQSALLGQIERPVTDDEARALTRLLGPDTYFELEFAIRRLIESAPGWPLWDVLDDQTAPIQDLRGRAVRSGFRPPEN